MTENGAFHSSALPGFVTEACAEHSDTDQVIEHFMHGADELRAAGRRRGAKGH